MRDVSVILQKCFSQRIWRIEILGTCCEIGLKWMPQKPRMAKICQNTVNLHA